MAYDLAMNTASGDLVVKDGDLMIVDNAERVAQQILITLRFWLGEWFLNTTDGVPYFEYILVKNPNEAHIKQIFREKIMNVKGVSKVNSIDLNLDRINRRLSVEYEATTEYGLVTRREVLGYGNSEIRS